MEKQMYHYATVSKALEELNGKGYTIDFNLDESMITEHPDDFEISHIYRYEGESDPGDDATVYGIRSRNGDKGVFVSGHFEFGEKNASRVLHELSIKGRQ